jgi:hypothetical protein
VPHTTARRFGPIIMRRDRPCAIRMSREDTMVQSNIVVDLSHHNGEVDLGEARDAGIVGIIHKATQGETFADAAYAGNRKKAADAGLLWGAYHFGSGGDDVKRLISFSASPRRTTRPSSCSTSRTIRRVSRWISTRHGPS